MFSRRLLRRLLAHYARVIECASATTSQAAPGYEDEILQMEHIAARSQVRQEAAPGNGEAMEGARGASKMGTPTAVYLATDAHFRFLRKPG